MQLFKFFHSENTLKQQKMVAFVTNCLVKMTLRLFQSVSVVMNMLPMLLRQFRRLSQGQCCRYANSLKELANFIAKPMKKRIQHFITYLLEIQARFLFLSRQTKMNNLLHVGLFFNHQQNVHNSLSTLPVQKQEIPW